MKILVIGGGGREHALAWKAAQSELADKVFIAPGNAGTANEPGIENVDIAADDIEALKTFALREEIGLTIVGPEAPLVAGIVNVFEAAGLKIFGPNRKAAQLEGSKAFTKDFLAKNNIPTAAYGNFTEVSEAIAYIKEKGAPIVVKADGLAAGKGVIVAQSEEEAIAAVGAILDGNRFGDAGNRVVIEECLVGEEASFICIVDGEDVLPMASSQDHKARDDGDKGPNTGGMGAYSPAPVVDEAMHERIMNEVILPTVKGMNTDCCRYRGFLYAGVMIDDKGTPNVLEYNCRFGDPETQPIMMRLKSDLVELCLAAVDGELASQTIEWDERASLGVVMAAGGYPDKYNKGDVISGLEEVDDENTKVFHAGTALEENNIVTNGGRVLCVVGLGDTVKKAKATAYEGVKKISWENAYYRTDIGHCAIKR